MNLLLQKETRNELLVYLSERPFRDVEKLVIELRNLPTVNIVDPVAQPAGVKSVKSK